MQQPSCNACSQVAYVQAPDLGLLSAHCTGAPRRQEAARAALALAAAEEEAMALRIEAEVRARVEAALASPEVQARIEARLREERATLEQKVRGLRDYS